MSLNKIAQEALGVAEVEKEKKDKEKKDKVKEKKPKKVDKVIVEQAVNDDGISMIDEGDCWSPGEVVLPKPEVVPFDPELFEKYPKVSIKDQVLLPTSVVKKVYSVDQLIGLASNTVSHRRVYLELQRSIFGYSTASTRLELEKLFLDRTFFHYVLPEGDFFLTADCVIENLQVRRKKNVLFVGTGVVAERITLTAFNIALCDVRRRYSSLCMYRSMLLVPNNLTVETNIHGRVRGLKIEPRYSLDAVMSYTLADSVIVGGRIISTSLNIDKSVLIDVGIQNSPYVGVSKSRLSVCSLTAPNLNISNSSCHNVELVANSRIHINDAKLSHKRLNSRAETIWINHALGLTRVDSPLLPGLTLFTSKDDQLGIHADGWETEPVYAVATDSRETVIETLEGWVDKHGVPVLTRPEVYEVMTMVVSRLKTLRLLSNLAESQGELEYHGGFEVPFARFDERDDCPW